MTSGLEGRDGPLVTHHDVFGGSFELLRILSSIHRVPVEIVDSTNTEAWLDAVSRAGAVLLEIPSNPLMRLIDIEGTVARAHACGAPVIVDNTVATPFNQRPFDFGADWIVHSTSKYLNGHSDMIGGCLVREEKLSAMLRIPMKADTCSNPYRTPFRACRTVVGAKRRSEGVIKGCPTGVKVLPSFLC